MLKHDYYIALLLPLAMLGFMLAAFEPQPAAAVVTPGTDSAVVFMYQRIGEDTIPGGNITLDQFEDQIEELKAGGYHVLPLADIVAGTRQGAAPLPEKSVAITFDGAYAQTISAAKKILLAEDFPFTVFFAADQGDGSGGHMTWDQLKNLRSDKRVTIGILPAVYTHMTENSADVNAALINRAVSKYRENFGEDPHLFAWPYGEYNTALKKQIAGYRFTAAFGQQSGVVYPGADVLVLPRFTMADEFADLDRFRLTAAALPLPVTDVVPDDITVADAQKPPLVGFTVAPQIKNLSRLSCFASGIGKVGLTHPSGNRIEIRLTETLQDRRTRINCTLPDGANWRWFGMILLSPAIAGEDDVGDSSPPTDGGDSD